MLKHGPRPGARPGLQAESSALQCSASVVTPAVYKPRPREGRLAAAHAAWSDVSAPPLPDKENQSVRVGWATVRCAAAQRLAAGVQHAPAAVNVTVR